MRVDRRTMNCGKTIAKLCIPSTVPPATDCAGNMSKFANSPSRVGCCSKRDERSVTSLTVRELVLRP